MDACETNRRKLWKWVYLLLKEHHQNTGLIAVPSVTPDGTQRIAFVYPFSERTPEQMLPENCLEIALSGNNAFLRRGEEVFVIEGFTEKEIRSNEMLSRLTRMLEPKPSVAWQRYLELSGHSCEAYLRVVHLLGRFATFHKLPVALASDVIAKRWPTAPRLAGDPSLWFLQAGELTFCATGVVLDQQYGLLGIPDDIEEALGKIERFAKGTLSCESSLRAASFPVSSAKVRVDTSARDVLSIESHGIAFQLPSVGAEEIHSKVSVSSPVTDPSAIQRRFDALPTQDNHPFCCATPDGSVCAAISSSDYIWWVRGDRPCESVSFPPEGHPVYGALTPDGAILARFSGHIDLISVAEKRLLRTLVVERNERRGAFSVDGEYLVFGGGSALCFLHLRTGTCRSLAPVRTPSFYGGTQLSFSGDGRLLACHCGERIEVFDWLRLLESQTKLPCTLLEERRFL